MLQELQARLPNARMILRQHVLSSRRHPGSPALTVFGVLVTMKHGPFTLRREYLNVRC
jgi:hypothetical protein